MTAIPNPRYERKLVVAGRRLPQVLAMLRHHPALFREVYPPRLVNSLYLDSPGLAAYTDHVRGASERVKTRIRWYGERWGRLERPSLERKIKRGMLGGKVSFLLPPIGIDPACGIEDLDSALRAAALPEALAFALRDHRPVLVVRYARRYLASADRCFRITVDADLRYLRVEGASGRLVCCPHTNGDIIVEVKYAPHLADDASRITAALPFRVTRCSKYIRGVDLIRAATGG